MDAKSCSLLAILLLVFCPGNSQLLVKNKDLIKRIQASQEIADSLPKILRSLLQTRKPLNVGGGNVSSCFTSVLNIISLKDRKKSFQYLDAAGKPQSGISTGNLLWLGSFDSCHKISDSHYCLLTFNITFKPSIQNRTKHTTTSLPIRWGSCIPNSCETEYDLRNVTEALLLKAKYLNISKYVDITYKQSTCAEKPQYTTDVVVTLVFCGFLLLLCLLGTIVDVITDAASDNYPDGVIRESKIQTTSSVMPNESHGNPFSSEQKLYTNDSQFTNMYASLVSETKSGKPWRVKEITGCCLDFLLCFSVVGNTKRIFATKVPATAITCINGLRVISMFWVILGHTFLFMFTSSMMKNPLDLYNDLSKPSMMVILNGYFSVDSFFFLSGLLVAYTCLRRMEKSNGRFNWTLFYVHRYWRLTPSLMFMILFYVKLRPLLTYAPLWDTGHSDVCNSYWWTNLIYINNFYPTDFFRECVSWSWYLANDMQFYVITPIFLILSYRFGWRGLFASVGSLLVLSSIIIASLIGYYNLDPMTLGRFNLNDPFVGDGKVAFENKIYTKPYCRIQPYLIGYLLGYFMHKNSSCSRKPGWMPALLGWLVAAAVALSLVYGPHEDVLPDGRRWTKAESIIYGTFERVLWGGVLAWVTYACHYNYGALIQQFLSARFWIPLSRLTYSAYLVHPIVLMFMYNGAKSTIFYSFATLSYSFIAAVVLSYGAAFILAVTIEFPCDNLENLALKSWRKRS